MAQPSQAIVGVVVEPAVVQRGPATWLYVLQVTKPDGWVGLIPDIVPASRPPLIIDAVSVAPGTPVLGFDIPGGVDIWFIQEFPDFAPCDPDEAATPIAGLATPGGLGPPGFQPPNPDA